MTVHYDAHGVTLHHGDCLDVLATLPDASVDAVVTDPPYGLEFMGKEWDKFGAMPSGGAGMTSTGYTDGGQRLARPSFMGSPNPPCINCGGTQRGADGQGVKRCRCDRPEFPNVRRAQSTAFGEWCAQWAAECLRVLKPGGHLLAFGGTRTWHRLACAIEDAGYEIRDSIAWMYGSGFPKSLDVSKAIDKAAGATREVVGDKLDRPGYHLSGHNGGEAFGHGIASTTPETRLAAATITAPATPEAATWAGWGTALKPAHEPIVVARKPLAGTVAANVLAHGTGALNVDACRIGTTDNLGGGAYAANPSERDQMWGAEAGNSWRRGGAGDYEQPAGRWPANVVLDESQAAALDAQSGERPSGSGAIKQGGHHRHDVGLSGDTRDGLFTGYDDPSNGPSRYFYTAKADATERPRVDGAAHPTVKPLDLMRWLVRLVTPPGGVVLEPFAGSGTTAEACLLEGFRCIAVEREADYLPLIVARITRQRDPVAHVQLVGNGDTPTLFDHL